MEKNLRKNKYVYMYNWITLLYIWNEHHIVNQLYFNKKNFLMLMHIYPLIHSIYLLNAFNIYYTYWMLSDIYWVPDFVVDTRIQHWETKSKLLALGFPGGAVVEGLPASAGDTGLSPGLGGSRMPRSD